MKPSRQSIIASTGAGAILGSLAMLGTGLLAIWVSGMFPAFSANRGFLQLVVAIPLALLAASGTLAFFSVLTPRQMLWAVLPIEGLIVSGTGVFGGVWAWPWAIAISVVLFVPWTLGLVIGRGLARR